MTPTDITSPTTFIDVMTSARCRQYAIAALLVISMAINGAQSIQGKPACLTYTALYM